MSVWTGTCCAAILALGCGNGACGVTVPGVVEGEDGLAACISAAVRRRLRPVVGCSEGDIVAAVGTVLCAGQPGLPTVAAGVGTKGPGCCTCGAGPATVELDCRDCWPDG